MESTPLPILLSEDNTNDPDLVRVGQANHYILRSLKWNNNPVLELSQELGNLTRKSRLRSCSLVKSYKVVECYESMIKTQPFLHTMI